MINRPYFRHFVIELTCADPKSLNSIEWIEQKTEHLLFNLRIKYLKNFYHQFSPSGISLLYILSSSHIAIHSWPKKNYLHIDLVTCSQNQELKSISNIARSTFYDKNIIVQELNYYEKKRRSAY